MATTQSLTVPRDAQAAVLIGYGPQTYGVIVCTAQGAIVALPFRHEYADKLDNIAANMRTDPQQAPADYVRGLPARLGWMLWGQIVRPGAVVHEQQTMT